MKYILADYIALRSWNLVPYAYYFKEFRNACGLKKDEYELLKRCDGIQEIEDSPLIQDLVSRRLCHPAKNGEALSSWQKEKICDNRYFPAINWMITGKCNCNCLHCFNAADNNRMQSEFTLDEAERLIAEAEACGINAFTITGGEPMLHPHFLEIIRSIYAHGMYVEELNTNGCFITQEKLDEMKLIGCRPLIKISFDGLGWHDWLRNQKGAEEDALRAIRLCIDNGFSVKVQANVHRHNIKTMFPTARIMNDMGVSEMRIIRTTESPRWKMNAEDHCLTQIEYFDEMLEFLREYTESDCRMEVDIWQFAHIMPKRNQYFPSPVTCGVNEYRGTLPVCKGNRGLIAVAADGGLYPCHQISGYYKKQGWNLGNVKKDGLQSQLQNSPYLQNVCTSLDDLKEHNLKCADCKWFKYCCGGCRTIALLLTDDIFGIDPSKCLFFEYGYLEKLQEVLYGYTNIRPID